MRVKYNDYPLDECAKAADEYVRQGCAVYQKFTCQHCGSRQAMSVANTFYARGTCEECGKETDIRAHGCNYLLVGTGDSVI